MVRLLLPAELGDDQRRLAHANHLRDGVEDALQLGDVLALDLEGADSHHLLAPRVRLRLLALQRAHALRHARRVLCRRVPPRREPRVAVGELGRELADLLGEGLVLAGELGARGVAHVRRVLHHQLQLPRVAVLDLRVLVQLAEVAPVRLLLAEQAVDHQLVGAPVVVGHVDRPLHLRQLRLQRGDLRRVLVLVGVERRRRYEAVGAVDESRELGAHGVALGGQVVVPPPQLRRLRQHPLGRERRRRRHDESALRNCPPRRMYTKRPSRNPSIV